MSHYTVRNYSGGTTSFRSRLEATSNSPAQEGREQHRESSSQHRDGERKRKGDETEKKAKEEGGRWSVLRVGSCHFGQRNLSELYEFLQANLGAKRDTAMQATIVPSSAKRVKETSSEQNVISCLELAK